MTHRHADGSQLDRRGARSSSTRDKTDVFISAEMTTTFPEDGCNIHVTVANMTEAQFAEINRSAQEHLRDDRLCRRADRRRARDGKSPRVLHDASADEHPEPAYGREGALAIEHIEKALLLCSAFEVQNGSRTKALNDLTLAMLEKLDRATIERLADKHGIEPKGETPWLKGIVGGSDDHAGINPGRTWTVFPHSGKPSGERRHRGDPAARDAPGRAARRPGHARALGPQAPLRRQHAEQGLRREGHQHRRAGPRAAPARVRFERRQVRRAALCCARESTLRRCSCAPLPRRARSGETVRAALPGGGPPACSPTRSSARHSPTSTPTAQTDDRIFFVIGTLLNRIFARYVREPAAGRLNLIGFVKQAAALATSNAARRAAVPHVVPPAELRLPHRARRAQDLRPRGATEGRARHRHVLRHQRRGRDDHGECSARRCAATSTSRW